MDVSRRAAHPAPAGDAAPRKGGAMALQARHLARLDRAQVAQHLVGAPQQAAAGATTAWSPADAQRLIAAVERHGDAWEAVAAAAGGSRGARACEAQFRGMVGRALRGRLLDPALVKAAQQPVRVPRRQLAFTVDTSSDSDDSSSAAASSDDDDGAASAPAPPARRARADDAGDASDSSSSSSDASEGSASSSSDGAELKMPEGLTHRQQLAWIMRMTDTNKRRAEKEAQRKQAEERRRVAERRAAADKAAREAREAELRAATEAAPSSSSAAAAAGGPTSQMGTTRFLSGVDLAYVPPPVKIVHGKVPIWRPPGFEQWPAGRKKLWLRIDKDPNRYYHQFCPPGVEHNTSDKWSEEETLAFVEALELHPPDRKWGLFSTNIYGRTGAQCERFYKRLRGRIGMLTKKVHDTGFTYRPPVSRRAAKRPHPGHADARQARPAAAAAAASSSSSAASKPTAAAAPKPKPKPTATTATPAVPAASPPSPAVVPSTAATAAASTPARGRGAADPPARSRSKSGKSSKSSKSSRSSAPAPAAPVQAAAAAQTPKRRAPQQPAGAPVPLAGTPTPTPAASRAATAASVAAAERSARAAAETPKRRRPTTLALPAEPASASPAASPASRPASGSGGGAEATAAPSTPATRAVPAPATPAPVKVPAAAVAAVAAVPAAAAAERPAKRARVAEASPRTPPAEKPRRPSSGSKSRRAKRAAEAEEKAQAKRAKTAASPPRPPARVTVTRRRSATRLARPQLVRLASEAVAAFSEEAPAPGVRRYTFSSSVLRPWTTTAGGGGGVPPHVPAPVKGAVPGAAASAAAKAAPAAAAVSLTVRPLARVAPSRPLALAVPPAGGGADAAASSQATLDAFLADEARMQARFASQHQRLERHYRGQMERLAQRYTTAVENERRQRIEASSRGSFVVAPAGGTLFQRACSTLHKQQRRHIREAELEQANWRRRSEVAGAAARASRSDLRAGATKLQQQFDAAREELVSRQRQQLDALAASMTLARLAAAQ